MQITDMQGNVKKSYCLNNVHTFNGVLYNTITSPALTETEEKYKYQTEDKTGKRKTAIEIDKANKRIGTNLLIWVFLNNKTNTIINT